MRRAEYLSRHMGSDQVDEADGSREADRCSRQQGSCHDQLQLDPLRIHAHGLCRFLPEGHHVHLSGKMAQVQRAGYQNSGKDARLLPAAAGKASHLPQKKLLHIVLFQNTDQGDQGIHEQRKHHACQNDGLILKSPVHPRRKCDHGEHRPKAEDKPRQRQGQKACCRKQETAHNHQRSTEGSAGGHSERITACQRVSQNRLHHRSAGRQRASHQEGAQAARKPQRPQDGYLIL